MSDTVVIAEEGAAPSGYRFSWGLAIAGGVVSTAVIFFLLCLGAGFGLMLVNPVHHHGSSLPVFLTGGAIYFFVAQAFGFALGGHLSGRLLSPLDESGIQEEFRAAAHGIAAWAVTVCAMLLVLLLAGLAAANTGAIASLYQAPSAKGMGLADYYVDELFRPEADSAAPAGDAASRAEANTLLESGIAQGDYWEQADNARLTALASHIGHVPFDAAVARVSSVEDQIRNATDAARRAASYASLWTALSLLFGALVAVAAAMLARAEDDRDALRV
jgi:hypothetical protein